MGHERVGALPKTAEWRRLVESIAHSAEAPHIVQEVASATLRQVRRRFDGIASDRGFQAAFGFLLRLLTDDESSSGAEQFYPRLDLASNPSALGLTRQLRSWVDRHADSLEYAELSKRAATDVIAFWSTEAARQHDIFAIDKPASQVWGEARQAGAFSDCCRVFFGKFVERYIKYFLDREASAQLPTIDARNRFAASLEEHVDSLAKHSFESTKITQSFAAGWYNKYARETVPQQQEVQEFLRFALSKLRQELLRESVGGSES